MLKQKRWLIPAMVAVVIFFAVVMGYILSRPQGSELAASIQILPEKTVEGGQSGLIASDSAFLISSDFSVGEQQLRGMLETEPSFNYSLGGSRKEWRLQPHLPLEDNTVYTIRVKDENNTVIRSFAFQTRSDLLIRDIFPADGEQYVDVTTGIEIGFNLPDIDLSSSFEIQPAVSGKFETNGYTVRFIPDTAFAPDNIYRVTIHAGLTAPSGGKLQKDYRFSFETTDPERDKARYEQLRLEGDYIASSLTGDELSVQLVAGRDMSQNKFDFTLHKFAGINLFTKELRAYHEYQNNHFGQKQEYRVDTSAMEEVFSTNGTLLPEDEYIETYQVPLPDNLSEGQYVFTLTGEDDKGNPQFVQQLIQISNVSVYAQSTNGETLLWLNDPVTGLALSGASVELEDAKTGVKLTGQAQTDGTIQLRTGESENAYLSITREGSMIYSEYLALSKQQEITLPQKYYTALYTDREIYHPNDVVQFWGVVSPRGVTAEMPDNVDAVIGTSWPESDIYRISVPVAEDGTFSGKIALTGVQKSWYRFAITDAEANAYTSKSIEVENYTKPPYILSLSTDKPYYYYNENVKFDIAASYFDGTPVSNGKFLFSCVEAGVGGDEGASITLDKGGKTVVSGRLNPYALGEEEENTVPSWEPFTIGYSVNTADEQDANVYSYETLLALPSKVAAKLESETPGTLTIRTAVLDESKVGTPAAQPRVIDMDTFDHLAGAPVDAAVNVYVHRIEHRQIPNGSTYDYVNKRVVPRYRSERFENVAKTVATKTVGGVVTLTDLPHYDPAEPNVNYWYEARFEGGVFGPVCATWRDAVPLYMLSETEGRYTFAPQDLSLGQGKDFTIGLYDRGRAIDNKGRILYSVVQRTPLTTGVYSANTQALKMEPEYLPNILINGAYFDGRYVHTMETLQVGYDYAEKTLQIKIDADKESYRPGDTANLTVTVTDANGNPVSASACIGVVDEAIFQLRQQDVDFAGQLYKRVYHGMMARYNSAMKANMAESSEAMDGAPNTGGGGFDSITIRSTFADTAEFKTIQTGTDGKGTLSVKLPDNITSWRVTAAAVTADLKAGDNLEQSITTLPFYLRPIVTGTYLAGDDVTASVRAVGTGLGEEDSIEYTASIVDTAGTTKGTQTVSGKAGEQAVFNFGKLEEGAYQFVITAKTGEYTDGVEKAFTVIQSGILLPRIQTVPLEEVKTIESAEWPVVVTVYDARMKPYMDTLSQLSGQTGGRTELLAASYRAQVLFQKLMPVEKQKDIYKDNRLEQIQAGEDGGVRLLPSGGSDPAVTAKLLMASPDLLNTGRAAQYLRGVLQNPAATLDDRIMAYMGLAAAKEPVLLDITHLLEQQKDTLTSAQKLYLGAALARLGDFNSAQKVYDDLKKLAVKEGDTKYVEGNGSPEDRLETTAAALMLTAFTHDEDAAYYVRYLSNPQQVQGKEGSLFTLEQLAYLEQFQLPEQGQRAKFSYVDTAGETKTVDLSENGCEALAFSSESFQKANLKATSGKTYAAVRFMDYAKNIEAKNDLVQIEKVYTPVGGSKIIAGGRVRVSLKVTFDENAPEGCYRIDDYIPSGMRYMEQSPYAMGENSDIYTGILENDGQTAYGYIYRSKPQEEEIEPVENRAGERAVTKAIPNTAGASRQAKRTAEQNSYTLVYYVSAAMPGSYVTESAYVTQDTQDVFSKSERGLIAIEAS